jgi:hypothetical protein
VTKPAVFRAVQGPLRAHHPQRHERYDRCLLALAEFYGAACDPVWSIRTMCERSTSSSVTGAFHGEAFEFFRNGDLDARGFFATGPEELEQNQFGFALGGPLLKNRLWFHGFYEGLREISGFTSAGYSPTPAMFSGDFANTGRVIYDSNTYGQVTGTRQPFPGNIIPLSRINPVARALSQYYLPGSSLGSLPSNVFGNPRNTLDDDQGGLRLDTALSLRIELCQHLIGGSRTGPIRVALLIALLQTPHRFRTKRQLWHRPNRIIRTAFGQFRPGTFS